LLAVAAATAFVWHWLAADPGYVRVHIRGITLETTVVVAVVALLLAWMLFAIGWQFLRWPFRAWGRSVKRRGRGRFADGLLALVEGDYARAERDLTKAAHHTAFRTPALLLRARAAHARDAQECAMQALDEVGDDGSRAADTLRARILIENGRDAEALAFLKEKKEKAADHRLSPRGERLRVDAALATGDTQAALDALPALARNPSLSAKDQAALETRVLAAALAAAPDIDVLDACWNKATRAQRKRPQLVVVYARRAAMLGHMLAAMDEIECAQRREWNDTLAAAYGELGPAEAETRLRKAQAWLAVVPDNAVLLTTIGRLYGQCAQWTQAIATLERALAIQASPRIWEALGDGHGGVGDLAAANTCYANALRLERGEPVTPLAARVADAAADVHGPVLEERSEHGVPRLPEMRSNVMA
jgi:HemY protein